MWRWCWGEIYCCFKAWPVAATARGLEPCGTQPSACRPASPLTDIPEATGSGGPHGEGCDLSLPALSAARITGLRTAGPPGLSPLLSGSQADPVTRQWLCACPAPITMVWLQNNIGTFVIVIVDTQTSWEISNSGKFF